MGDFGMLLRVINEQDEVVDTLPSEQIHEQGLLHRAMHIVVINHQEELFVRERSLSMELYPGVWTTSVGEHVFNNEDYPDTAKRALKEFLGLNTEVRFLGKIRVHDEVENELVAVYATQADAVPHLNREHSEKGEFLSVDRVEALIASGVTTPHLAAVIELSRRLDRGWLGQHPENSRRDFEGAPIFRG